MDMNFQGEDSLLMCASSWSLHPPEDELVFEVGQSVNPVTIMARMGRGTRQHIRFVDTYCGACLIESALRVHSARRRAHEPLKV
jgi:hypothetical protein